MKKITEKVSYLNYCLYICGVMKDDGFHRNKTKPNKKLLPLKFKKMEKLISNVCNLNGYANSIGGGYYSLPLSEAITFMDGDARGIAVFSAIEMNLSSEQNNNRNIGSGWQ